MAAVGNLAAGAMPDGDRFDGRMQARASSFPSASTSGWPAAAQPAACGVAGDTALARAGLDAAEASPAPACTDAASRLADRAVRALLDEADLSPKPGLVDRRGSGAHLDLDLDLMHRSAQALRPWFGRMAAAAFDAGAPTLLLRRTLGRLGRDAEAAMLDATGGVNTHRGAIWALGLLVAAAALDAAGAPLPHDRPGERRSPAAPQAAAARIAALAGLLARLPDPDRPPLTGHKGEAACRMHGVGGARGQAQAGFPQVIEVALPALARSRTRGNSETAARLDALVALIAVLDDTCVLSRAGAAGLALLQVGATAVIAAGGVATFAGRRALHALDADALVLGASPGGAADLLAAALFLDRQS